MKLYDVDSVITGTILESLGYTTLVGVPPKVN